MHADRTPPLDPAGLWAAQRAVYFCEPAEDGQWDDDVKPSDEWQEDCDRYAEAAVRAYLAAAVPAPTTENPPGEAIGEIARQLVGIGVPVGLAKMAAVAGYDAGFAAGRAAATPPAEGSVSYRVRDRDSDYKAMCHEDRDHAELLLKAWLADGRDAVIERRHVFDGGWLPVGRPFFTEQQERALDRCEAFDAANLEPETDT